MRRIYIFVFLFAIAFLRVMSAMVPDTQVIQERFLGTGIVVSAPVFRGTVQTFTVRFDHTTLDIVAAQYPDYRYGDWLSIACRKIQDAICLFPTIHVLGEKRGNPFLHVLYATKDHLARGLSRVLPEPHASFAQALLLGQRSSMPEELRDAFQKTGTTHIVAVSGMHIVILGEMVKVVLGFFAISARSRRLVTVFFLLFFTAMISAPASAVRGLLFGLLLLFAEASGRPRQMSVALAVTCAVLLLWRPSFLFDLGFQLSFLAVIGIVYGVPVLTHVLRKWIPEHPIARGAIAMAIVTFSATLVTAPLLAAVFGRTSLVSIIANLFIVPLVESATILTLMTALLALLHTLIAFPFGIVLFGLLDVMMRIAWALAKIPGASLDVVAPRRSAAYFPDMEACGERERQWSRPIIKEGRTKVTKNLPTSRRDADFFAVAYDANVAIHVRTIDLRARSLKTLEYTTARVPKTIVAPNRNNRKRRAHRIEKRLRRRGITSMMPDFQNISAKIFPAFQ